MQITYHLDGYINLPKWPAFVVAGDKVSTKQAAEILIRTDANLPNFTYSSNNTRLCEQLNGLFNIPTERNLDTFNAIQQLKEEIGVLPLNYLNNHQIASMFIGGPHGWCDWAGNIFCNSFNIGKWPEVEQVAEDWARIAAVFPYLNLRSQLFSGESCEDDVIPVVEFVIKEGKVTVYDDPKQPIVPPVSQSIESMTRDLFNPSREQGISTDSLKEKLIMVYGEVPTLK